MTTEEAIQAIELARAEVEWNYPIDYTIAFDMAIAALNKQVPKNATEPTEGSTIDKCPVCGQNVSTSGFCCRFCGQAPT